MNNEKLDLNIEEIISACCKLVPTNQHELIRASILMAEKIDSSKDYHSKRPLVTSEMSKWKEEEWKTRSKKQRQKAILAWYGILYEDQEIEQADEKRYDDIAKLKKKIRRLKQDLGKKPGRYWHWKE